MGATQEPCAGNGGGGGGGGGSCSIFKTFEITPFLYNSVRLTMPFPVILLHCFVMLLRICLSFTFREPNQQISEKVKMDST